MRVDIVADLWSNLETGYVNSKMKSRREYAERLVSFTGKPGSVKGLQAHLKEDLDGSADAIYKYNAICNMLDLAERWLLTHHDEIPDLDDWLIELQKSQSLDESRISAAYESNSGRKLLDSIKLGYVFPGLYGKSENITFPAALPGYFYFSSYQDLNERISEIIKKASEDGASFEKQVIHILMEIMTQSDISFPCVFVDASLLKNAIVKHKTIKKVKESGVKVLPTSDTLIDLDYSVGRVNMNSSIGFQVYTIRCN